MSENRFLAGIDRASHRSLVAVRTDLVVGSLGISADDTGLAEIGMFLASNERGRGLGSDSLCQALASAETNPDVHEVALQVGPHNTTENGDGNPGCDIGAVERQPAPLP